MPRVPLIRLRSSQCRWPSVVVEVFPVEGGPHRPGGSAKARDGPGRTLNFGPRGRFRWAKGCWWAAVYSEAFSSTGRRRPAEQPRRARVPKGGVQPQWAPRCPR